MSQKESHADYIDFLKTKIVQAAQGGFDVSDSDINPMLYPHQRDIVKWAVQGGSRAIFAAFGLGKTFMQIEALRLVQKHAGGKVLIICPLGVRQEFRRDGEKLGVHFQFVRRAEEMGDGDFFLTNYESVRDGKLDPNNFAAVSLDEASVLRSFGSKTYQEFLTLFQQVAYKFVCTATPSPNRFKELIHYAGFLGVMDTGQALTRFFQRDSTQANNLTLYPHKEREFWLWLNTWAIFLQRPSDLGYDDTGYDLPPLDVIYHEVPADHSTAGADRDGQMNMFRDAALGLKDAATEKRDSLPARIAAMMEVINGYIGRTEGVSTRVLHEKPGAAPCGAKGARKAELRGEQGGLQAKVAEVERGKPGALQRADEAIFCSERGETQGAKQGVLQEQQAQSSETGEGEQVEGIWVNAGTVRRNGGGTRWALSDLPAEDDEASRGSRSRNGGGAGAALHQVQLGDRAITGQPGSADASCGLLDQIVLWCDLNDEQRAVEAALTAAGIPFSSIYGSLSTDECERRLEEWRNKKTCALIAKPVMLGSGVNLQQCNKAIFVGITYKFNDLIQAIHRTYRFLQNRICEIHIIYSESEREILRALQAKWTQHNDMVDNMTAIIKEHGLNSLSLRDLLARSIGVERIEVSGDNFRVANNDCVIETRGMAENSVGLIHTSIPFANHYEYTPSYNDFGHTENNDRFWAQMDFLAPELLRILQPGRIYACHVKDRINFGNVTGKGAPTVSPFHCETIAHYTKHGFDYMGMITVVTDVVRENNQTYRLGWSEQCKDGSKMGMGSPEYICIFRKPQTDRTKGYADDPIRKSKDDYSRARWQTDAHAFWRSSGDRLITAEEMAGYGPAKLAKMFTDFSMAHVYDHEFHVRIGEELDIKGALPSTFMSLAPGSHCDDVWHDVNRMLTLNGSQTQRGLQNHVCPLQFDIVDRIIRRYSNPGDMVFDPFGGLMTVPVRALKLGRKGSASELNTAYFFDGVHYLQAMENELAMPSLFDVDEAA